MIDAFDFDKNYCMVFEKLGLSLNDFIKNNKYKGYYYYFFLIIKFFFNFYQKI